MIIQFAEPGYPWELLLWPAGITAGLILLVILTGGDGFIRFLAETLSVLGIAATLILALVISLDSTNPLLEEAKVAALEELGFESVIFDSGRGSSNEQFTAARGGAYFSGTLVALEAPEGRAYLVVELPWAIPGQVR